MSEKKRPGQYEEGHKRETRKSYQAFIEDLMSEHKTEGSSDGMLDDSSVRRSKRTPVPKRGFKLIDDYDSKEPSKKKNKASSNDSENDNNSDEVKDDRDSKGGVASKVGSASKRGSAPKGGSGSNEKYDKEVKSKRVNATEHEINSSKKSLPIKEEKIDEDESSQPRKSGRVRKVKSFDDSVTPQKKTETKIPVNVDVNSNSDSKRRKTLSNQKQGNKPDSKSSAEDLCNNLSSSESIDTKRRRACTIIDKEEKHETPKGRFTSPKKGRTLCDSDTLVDNVDSKRRRSCTINKDNSDNSSQNNRNSISENVDSKSSRNSIDKNNQSDKKELKKTSDQEISDCKRKRNSIDKDTQNDRRECKKKGVINTEEMFDSKRKRNSMDKNDQSDNRERKKTQVFNDQEILDSKRKRNLQDNDNQYDRRECKKSVNNLEEVNSSNRKRNSTSKNEKLLEKPGSIHSNSSDLQKSPMSVGKKRGRLAHLSKCTPIKNCNDDEKNPYFDTKDVKFEEEMLVPSLAESVKSRRNHKKSISETTDQPPPSNYAAVITKPSKLYNLTKLSKRKDSLPCKEEQPVDKNEEEPKSKETKKSTKLVKHLKVDESFKPAKECKGSPKKELLRQACNRKKVSTSSAIKEDDVKTLENGNMEKQLSSNLKQAFTLGAVNGIKEEVIEKVAEAPLVLTLNLSPLKKKDKKNHVSKTSKLSKKVDSKKNKNKKKAKLIVSFKNNHSFQPKKKRIKEEKADIDYNDSVSDNSQLEQPSLEKDLLSPLEEIPNVADDNSGVSKHKKKSKKKSKLKKHQKLTDVQRFGVKDTAIIKVKKKKIYKKRNGEKILIRIIKNHCNKSGEVVKTETIMVDKDTPLDDDTLNESCVDENKIETVKTEVKLPDKQVKEIERVDMHLPKVENKKEKKRLSGEKKVSVEKAEPKLPKKQKEDSPEFVPPAKIDPSVKRKSNFKRVSGSKIKTSSEKRVISKKPKHLKKPLSRPANKNVTVGGKVVGKTTKGMKKTGDFKGPPKPVVEPVPKEIIVSPPISEPKNVYNFFCRKYRPIVVQQFPKAGFSEISRRLAALWKTLSEVEKQEHRDKFEEIHSVSQQKLSKLNRLSPTMWSESDVKFIKKNIGENDAYTDVFAIPRYPAHRLKPIDMGAHLSLLGDSLNVISGALQQQSSMTVHGAMSVLLDSILCALAPLIFFTSHIPEMECIDESQQARILDNVAYILPGL